MNKLLFLSIVFLLFSCSKKSTKIDTNQIYQQYRIVYNETSYTTFVGCKIRKEKHNGLGIKFVENDFLSIMGSQQKYSPGLYEYDETYTSFLDSVYIKILHNGTSIDNYFKFNDVSSCSIPTSETTIFHGFYWYFTWNGPPLESYETIKLKIFNDANEEVFSWESGKYDYTSLSIPPSEYEDQIQPGSYRMTVTREKTGPLKIYTASGGDVQLVYVDEEYVTFY